MAIRYNRKTIYYKKYINYCDIIINLFIFRQACAFLLDQLKPLPPNEQNLWLNKLTAHVQTQELKLPVVGQNEIELAIKVKMINNIDNHLN